MGKKKERPKLPRIAWSYSHWDDYVKCPALYYYKRVEKRKPARENPYTARGIDVHKEAEKFLLNPRFKTPPGCLSAFKAPLMQFKKQKAMAEQKWAFDKNWNPVEFFDARAWVRMVTDIHVYLPKLLLVDVVDIKTGKPKDSHYEQSEIYGVASLLNYGKAKKAGVAFWYADHGKKMEEEYKRSELPALVKTWEKRAETMMGDPVCAPLANPACRWCGYAKRVGGPCPVGV